jgi:isopenicillin-N N-acyltransferase-like protein
MKKKLKYSLVGIVVFFAFMLVYFILSILILPPKPKDTSALNYSVSLKGNDFYKIGNNWLKKSNSGLWEMYVEGEAYQRGVINGKLTRGLAARQEDDFIGQIKTMVPSMAYLNFLKYFVAWFNRHLDDYISEEYKLEIYGVSASASDKYDFIGPKYQRMLNYHAAHDIGHFLQEKNLVVGCTSFSAWDEKSEDSTLIVGRNFDFYVGDKFSENKIISFTNPEHGYKFMSVTWGGMIGVVSGMNEKGLCLTINAARSAVPSSAATPVSIVAREILQYASNIQEAFAIAQKRKTFIAQSIMVGSARDNRTAIIEKSIEQTSLFQSDTNYIICANHFQSVPLKNDPLNLEQMKESHSVYRFGRMTQLIGDYPVIGVKETAAILRDQKGLDDKNIGMRNEKSLNSLIAHHSIIFKPSQGLVWVSTSPFQLGEFVAYDLNKIFSQVPGLDPAREITEERLVIPADSFLYSQDFKNFKQYKILQSNFKNAGEKRFSEKMIREFIQSNPEFYQVYASLGDYFKTKKEYVRASAYYKTALGKEIPWSNDSLNICKHLKEVVALGKK